MEEQPGTDDWRQWRAPGFHLEAIGFAWTWITREMSVWPVAVLLWMLIAGVVSIPFSLPMLLEPPRLPTPGAGLWAFMPWSQHSWYVWAILYGGDAVAGAFLFPIYGGILLAALRRLRGEQVDASRIFELRGNYWRLVATGAILQAINIFAFAMCILPAILVAPLFMFAPLLVVDRRLGAWDSIKLSARTIGRQYWPALGFYIVVGLVSALGFFLCCIGIVFSLPIQFLAITIVYNEFFPPAQPDGAEFQS